MRKRAALATISAAAAVGGLALADSVSAASTETYGTITQQTKSYTNPTNQSNVVHSLVPNQNVLIRCSIDGQSIGGDDTWYWMGRDESLGFIHASTVEVKGHVGEC